MKSKENTMKYDKVRYECSFSQDMGSDCNGLHQPSYSLHVQEIRDCDQDSWGTHEVFTHNAPNNACDAICTCGNYDETFSSLVKVYGNKL